MLLLVLIVPAFPAAAQTPTGLAEQNTINRQIVPVSTQIIPVIGQVFSG
jgi:hypothetical protein